MATMDRLALLYEADAYQSGTGPLTDRRLLARTFLDGLLQYGQAGEVVVVAREKASLDAAKQHVGEHPLFKAGKRKARVARAADLLRAGRAQAPAPVLHLPGLIETRLLWLRSTAPGAFALTGSLTTPPANPAAVAALQQLAVAPTEPYDALLFPSDAVRQVVRGFLDQWAAYLRDRTGGGPTCRMRLEVIPPALDPADPRPADPEQRRAARQAAKLRDDEVAVLTTGPHSLHMRAAPFPLVQALSEAARAAGRPVHLLLGGPATSEAVLRAVADCVRVFGANVRASVHDQIPWHAADLYAIGGDSPHETTTVNLLQAMGAGLPVVAADWAGAREVVAEGETGFLVPTRYVGGASADASLRLLLGDTTYDNFLAEVVQAVAVDLGRFGGALARLIGDADLRRRFGAEGRRLVEERHSPRRVVQLHEALWSELAAAREAAARPAAVVSSPAYPMPEVAFAPLATAVLDGTARVQVAVGEEPRLFRVKQTAATGFAEAQRSGDLALLQKVFAAAREPVAVADLDAVFAQAGVSPAVGRGTVAWLLKHGLFRLAD